MEPQYYLNTYSEEPLTARIVELIRGAKTYIKTGNFFFREPNIQEELVKACRRGVILFIISNLREDGKRLAASNKFTKADYDPHLPNLMDLVEEGAHIRCIEELHAKFLLVDGEKGMIMSSNYTVNSLHGNPECGADLSASDTRFLERIFDTIFSHADIRLVGRKSDGYTFKFFSDPILDDEFVREDEDTDIVMTLAANRNKDGEKIDTNFVNCNILDIYHEIGDIIDDAGSFVCLAAYSFRQMEKLPHIRQAIVNSAKRGISVNLIYNSEQPDSYEEIMKLRQIAPNIHFAGLDKNHAKFLITDKCGFIFTANIDGKAGLLSGFELGVYLNDTQYQQAKQGINILAGS